MRIRIISTFLLISLLPLMACQRGPTVSQLLSSDPNKRGKALAKLESVSLEKRAKLIEGLITALEDNDSRKVNRAVDALSVMGESSVPALRGTLKNKDVYARLNAALALGLIGDPAMVAVPDIAQLLKDPHPLVRDEAALALGYIGPKAEKAVPALIETLKDKVEEVRHSAAGALDKIGTEEALKALKKFRGAKGTS